MEEEEEEPFNSNSSGVPRSAFPAFPQMSDAGLWPLRRGDQQPTSEIADASGLSGRGVLLNLDMPPLQSITALKDGEKVF